MKRIQKKLFFVFNRLNQRWLIGLLVACGVHAELTAQSIYTFAIPEQALSKTLPEVSVVTESNIIFDAALVEGKLAPELIGEFTLDAALKHVLAGSDLEHRVLDSGIVTIKGVELVDLGDGLGDDKIVHMPTQVITASGFERDVLDAPASISVVDGEALRSRRFHSLQDAVYDIPGVNIVGGNGVGNGISIRGMETGQTLVLVDGRPLNSSREANPKGGMAEDLESNWIPPVEAIDRIEVVRGPMSSLYGANAVGGVVNVITKRVSPVWSGGIGADYTLQGRDELGDHHSYDFSVNGPIVADKLGLQIWGYQRHREQDDVEDGAQESDKYGLTARAWLTPVEAHDIMFEYGWGKQDFERYDPTTGVTDEGGYRRESWALAHTGRWDLGTSDVQYYEETTERYTDTVPTDAVVRTLDGKFTAPIGNHTAILGFRFKETEATRSEFKDPLGSASYDTRTSEDRAYFAENEWRVTPTVSLTLGARLNDNEFYGEHLTPRGYVVWRAHDNWTIKTGIGTGFEAPGIREIDPNVGVIQRRGAILAFGNPDLEPEKSTNYELGVYFENDSGDFTANATAFYNDFENKIINTSSYEFYYADGTRVPAYASIPVDPVTGATTTTPAWGTWLNLPGAKIWGLETAAKWKISSSVTLDMTYTLTKSEIDGEAPNVTAPNGESLAFTPGGSGVDGEPLAATPKHKINAKLSWDPLESLSLYLRGNYESKVTSVSFGKGSVSEGDHSLTTFDLGMSWYLTEALQLNATLYNLADQVRYDPDALDYRYPEDGRRLWMGMRYRF